MKRLIFSQYTDKVRVDDFKANQFKLYKDKIIESHKAYANLCGADYELFELNAEDYDNLQFQKLFKMEELAETYDEILYLDFDVIPRTDENFFEVHDLNKICVNTFSRYPEEYPPHVSLNYYGRYEAFPQTMDNWLEFDSFDRQSIYVKAACANAMSLAGDGGYDKRFNLINTGVIGMSSDMIKTLNFSNELEEMDEIFEDAMEFSAVHKNISKYFFRNNESFMTYLVNSKDLPIHNIGHAWNSLIDDLWKEVPDNAKFIHYINKEFEKSFTL